MMDDLRLELRCRNNVLWHAIFDLHPSVSDFCRTHGISNSFVGRLLNLKEYPRRKDGEWWLSARRLSEVTGLGCDELFPETLYTTEAFGLRHVAEVPSIQYVPLSEAAHLMLPATQEDDVERQEVADLLRKGMIRLTPREQLVIDARMGEDEQTFRQVGETINLSSQRVRQIEANSLRKMRHAAGTTRLAGAVFVEHDRPEDRVPVDEASKWMRKVDALAAEVRYPQGSDATVGTFRDKIETLLAIYNGAPGAFPIQGHQRLLGLLAQLDQPVEAT